MMMMMMMMMMTRTRRTIHDYMSSLAFMPNEPTINTWQGIIGLFPKRRNVINQDIFEVKYTPVTVPKPHACMQAAHIYKVKR